MKKSILLIFLFFINGIVYGEGLSHYEKELIQRVKEVFGEAESETKYETSRSGLPKCAVPILLEAKNKFENLSSEAQGILKEYLKSPSLSYAYDTPEGHFKIHYATSGCQAVYRPDVDIIYKDGVPDYVNRCGWILEEVWSLQIETLGYQPPPDDGDQRYDVYLKMIGYMGLTLADGFSTYPSCTSYMILRTNYLNSEYQDQYDVMRIAAAHEFFHAIQFGYDCTELAGQDSLNSYWFEISSVWMEDIAYDYVNDYLDLLRYFFPYPHFSLEAFSSDWSDPRVYHPYGSCIWAFYLTEKYGIDIMKKIWTKCGEVPGYNTITSTNSVLDSLGSSYDDAFREFTLWNFFTHNRADTVNFYSEGNLFDADSKIKPGPGQNHSFSAEDSFYKSGVTYPPEHLGSNYIFFYPEATSCGGARLYFYGDSAAKWRVSIIGYKPGNSSFLKEMSLDFLQNGFVEVMNANLHTELVMITAVTNKTGGPWNFSYAAKWDPLLVQVKEDEKEGEISGFHLEQNYPNPFNPYTTIPFRVHGKRETENGPIRTTLVIYNILGQKVRTLVDKVQKPGRYEVVWDGKDRSGVSVSSGIYFYKLKAGDFEQVKKLVFLK